jgi:hypothetical protein
MYLVEQMTQGQQKLSLVRARGILESTPMKEEEMADNVNPTEAFIGRWWAVQVDDDEEPSLEDTCPMSAVRTWRFLRPGGRALFLCWGFWGRR